MESFCIGKLDRGLKILYRELEGADEPDECSFFNWGIILVENIQSRKLVDFISKDDDYRIIDNINDTTFIISKRVPRPLIINTGLKPCVFGNSDESAETYYHFQFTEHHRLMIHDFVDHFYETFLEQTIKIYVVANVVPLKLIFVPSK